MAVHWAVRWVEWTAAWTVVHLAGKWAVLKVAMTAAAKVEPTAAWMVVRWAVSKVAHWAVYSADATVAWRAVSSVAQKAAPLVA